MLARGGDVREKTRSPSGIGQGGTWQLEDLHVRGRVRSVGVSGVYIKSRRAGRDAAPVPAQRTALAELGLAAGPPMSNGLGWAVVLLVFSFFLRESP